MSKWQAQYTRLADEDEAHFWKKFVEKGGGKARIRKTLLGWSVDVDVTKKGVTPR